MRGSKIEQVVLVKLCNCTSSQYKVAIAKLLQRCFSNNQKINNG